MYFVDQFGFVQCGPLSQRHTRAVEQKLHVITNISNVGHAPVNYLLAEFFYAQKIGSSTLFIHSEVFENLPRLSRISLDGVPRDAAQLAAFKSKCKTFCGEPVFLRTGYFFAFG